MFVYGASAAKNLQRQRRKPYVFYLGEPPMIIASQHTTKAPRIRKNYLLDTRHQLHHICPQCARGQECRR